MPSPDDELQLRVTPAERAALIVVADLGLDAIEEFRLVPNTATTLRAVEKLRGGNAMFTRTEALALQNAVSKGFGAARRFGVPIDLEVAQRADGKLAGLF